MAKRSFKVASYTPAATADTANMTNQTYQALQGGSSTQMTAISEVSVSGLASSSAPTPMLLAHDSTIGVTLSGLTTFESDAPLHTATAALAAPPTPFTQATTKPQRDATRGLLSCGINAFGGIYKWTAYQESDEIWMLGNTASLGEISLSCANAGTPGLVMSHILYETK